MSSSDPDPEYDLSIIRNNRLQVGCLFWQPAEFLANSDGVIQPSAVWGRLWLLCMRQASILHRASSIEINQFSFRHSCRSLPLHDSTVVLSVGVPGREKSIRISRSYTHLSSIFPANLKPLSVFRSCSGGRLSAMLFSISATSEDCSFWPTQIPRHPRV